MKKLSILSAICGMAVFGAASAADITIFYSPTCPHCHHAREFIGGQMVYEYPNLAVREVNVMMAEARPMFEETLKKCEYESGGVPVIVVGEKCFQGYADFMQDDLRTAVEVDMTDADKTTASENRKAFADDADAFKTAHADRANAVTEYVPAVDTPQKKTDSHSSMYFYVLLIALVAALGFVLVRRDAKK